MPAAQGLFPVQRGDWGRCAAFKREIRSPALSQGLLTRRLMAPFRSQRLLRRARYHTGVSILNGSLKDRSRPSYGGKYVPRTPAPGVSFTSSFIRYHNSLWASILSRFSCAMGKRDKNREKPAARHRMPRNFVPAFVRDRRRWYNKIKKIGHVVRKE